MGAYLQPGMSWNSLKCVAVFNEQEIAAAYDGGSTRSLRMYRLQCECGKEFEIFAKNWKGKRYTKDCGCGRAIDDELVSVKFRIPLLLMHTLKHAAHDEILSTNQFVIEMIKQGLKLRAVNKFTGEDVLGLYNEVIASAEKENGEG